MMSSASIKLSIAIIVIFVLVPVSSFNLPSLARHSRGIQFTSYTRCHATTKRNTEKTSISNISGIGGLNIGNKSFKTKRSSIETNTKMISKPNTKKVVASKLTNEKSATTKISWSNIILAFLIPWRNPNSLFLYMFIIVSVLGKLNENPQ